MKDTRFIRFVHEYIHAFKNDGIFPPRSVEDFSMINREFIPFGTVKIKMLVIESEELNSTLWNSFGCDSYSIQVKHLLISTLQNPDSEGYRLLEASGLPISNVIQEIEQTASPMEESGVKPYMDLVYGFIPLSSTAHRYRLTFRSELAIYLTLCEAAQMGCHIAGTGHLILGIMSEGFTPASQVLMRYMGSIDSCRQSLKQMLCGKCP